MRFLPLLLLAMPLVAADHTVLLLTTSGELREAPFKVVALKVTLDGRVRTVPVASLLSLHNGAAASAFEVEQISAGLATVQGADVAARDGAVERLTFMGLPVVTPLLKAYKDTDQHEPRPLYRLFERVMPSVADGLDRTLSMVRLADGTVLRGTVESFSVGGVAWEQVRMMAVKRKSVVRNADVHSIRHSTQIEFFDTAVVLSAGSAVTVAASGFTRLSWSEDGWASDPNGLQKPGSPAYKTNLVDGHPFGALVGRVSGTGARFFVGATFKKAGLGNGRLQLAINDNRHWQNNVGSYRVKVTATEAYDVGDGQ